MMTYKLSKKILLVAFVGLCGFSVNTLADGPGWTIESNVELIVTVINGGINVKLSPDLNGCTSQSGYGEHFASIYPDHAGVSLFQSNLLAAMMSGKKVRLYLMDSTCKVGEMIIYE